MKMDEFRLNISPKFVPRGLISQYSSIVPDNGLAPIGLQANIWTNDN